jgi:hypothetical protein
MRDNAFYIPNFKNSILTQQLFYKPKHTSKLYNPDGVLDLNDSIDFHEMTLDDRIEINPKNNVRDSEIYSYWNYYLDILNLQPTSSLSYDENIMYDSEDEDENLDKEKEQYKDDCFEDNCDL